MHTTVLREITQVGNLRPSEMDVHRRKREKSAYRVYKKYFLKQERQYWILPLTDSRLKKRRFRISFADLRENPDKFINYFRMRVQTFDEHAGNISGMSKSQNTCMRLSVPPLEMLAINKLIAALRYKIFLNFLLFLIIYLFIQFF